MLSYLFPYVLRNGLILFFALMLFYTLIDFFAYGRMEFLTRDRVYSNLKIAGFWSIISFIVPLMIGVVLCLS